MEATTTFLESRIAQLESQLKLHQNCDYWKSENGRVQGQIIELIRSAYAEELDAKEILVDLARIIDFNPTKEIQFTATISFTGTIEVSMEDEDDFDLTSALEDAYVDINNGNVVIDSYELYDANEC